MEDRGVSRVRDVGQCWWNKVVWAETVAERSVGGVRGGRWWLWNKAVEAEAVAERSVWWKVVVEQSG